MTPPQDYYSEIAAGYNELHGAEQDEKLQEFLSRVITTPEMELLDIGCGTGRSATFTHLHWQGIEPSKGLIAQAPPAVQENITQGIGEELPYPDNQFDIVLSLTALQNFSDPAAGLREMTRVVKKEGLVLLSFLKKSPRAEELDRLIRKEFTIKESWEQSKDWMYICVPRAPSSASKYI